MRHEEVSNQNLSVLLIEDNPGDARLFREYLTATTDYEFDIKWMDCLSTGLEFLQQNMADAILLDLSLPDSHGIDTLESVRSKAPGLPVIVLTGLDDEQFAVNAVKHGAQDYLVKSEVQPDLLARSVLYAIERKKAEDKLRLFRSLLDQTVDAISVVEPEIGRFLDYNESTCRLTGYSHHDLNNMHIDDLKMFSAGSLVWRDYVKTLRGKQSDVFESKLSKKDGGIVPIEISTRFINQENDNYIVSVIRDISERKRAQKEIQKLAYFDTLTSLPNRTLFEDRLRIAIENARRNDEQVAVMFLDLDRFKRINDSLGHNIGDKLLQQVAGRLKHSVRNTDTVTMLRQDDFSAVLARQGGDEFTLLASGIRRSTDVAHLGQRILANLRNPIYIGDQELVVSGSIGVAFYPEDGQDTITLLRNADTAMYQAKQKGRDKVVFYTAAMNADAQKLITLETELRTALAEDQLLVHYQPKFSINPKKLVGMEALIRWQHPEQGLLYPGDFLPVAEESGLIGPIGDWVLETVCHQIRDWQDHGVQPVKVSVNISNQQFHSGKLDETVANLLARTGIAADYLELELTENIIMENVHIAMELLDKIKLMGVMISIDDFGTGYSSMSYLKRLPVDILKIDRSFVSDIVENPEDSAIARSIITLGHSLDLKVIAEGVENNAQLEQLAKEGCDEIQGFLFSRPISAELIEQQLSRTT
jgi:diguanylate cyclase (GGDEF)-like protein/PAS domain S-box-containing protein